MAKKGRPANDPIIIPDTYKEEPPGNWLSPFRIFEPREFTLLKKWEEHYERLGIKTCRLEMKTGIRLLVNAEDTEKEELKFLNKGTNYDC